MKAKRILETALYVNDLDLAEKFYQEILGLELIQKTTNRDAFFRCGDTMLLLFNPEQTKLATERVPTHGSIGQGHLAFGVPEPELQQWKEHLRSKDIEIEKEITWEKGTRSIYFRDPSGNSLELISENHWF